MITNEGCSLLGYTIKETLIGTLANAFLSQCLNVYGYEDKENRIRISSCSYVLVHIHNPSFTMSKKVILPLLRWHRPPHFKYRRLERKNRTFPKIINLFSNP
jgi:hypothetical protein